MVPLYEMNGEELVIKHRKSGHISPHLHHALEFVYVTDGTLEIGMGTNLFHMETGDFAVIFPDVIHHYQVFSEKKSMAYYLMAPQNSEGPFSEKLRKYCPENPVIRAKNVHPDILSSIKCMFREPVRNPVVDQAYVQIILARSIPEFRMVEKQNIGSQDIVYKTVAYIAAHFKEEISLDSMACGLGVSKFALSRVFSGVFHRNFKQYLNERRLEYACSLLEYTDKSVTDICMDAGFESQRTFNRVFAEKYRLTPREYRNRYRETLTENLNPQVPRAGSETPTVTCRSAF